MSILLIFLAILNGLLAGIQGCNGNTAIAIFNLIVAGICGASAYLVGRNR